MTSGKKTGKLTFLENSKLTSALQSIPVLQSLKNNIGSTVKNEQNLKITVSKGFFEQPYLLQLTDQSFDGVDDMDALKIGDGHVSISSKVNNAFLSIDKRQISKEVKLINLNVSGTESGMYKLLFETSPAMTNKIKLVDAFLNTRKEITTADNTYSFLMDKLIPASMGSDRFTVFLEQSDDNITLTKNFKIYPNPFRDNLTLQFEEALQENTNLIITDMLGRTINLSSIKSGTSLHYINTQNLSEGSYLLRLISDKSKKVLTVLKLLKI